MSRISKIPWIDLLNALLLYAAVLIYQGYQYGQGDQSQILPCLYAQDHPGAYPGDLYVRQYLDSPINERTLFHFIFRFLGYDQPWMVWLLHVIFSLTLLYGWLRIAALGINSRAFQCMVVALILIPGFHTSVGANELYYNSFIPSLAAKAIATWSIFYWLKERFLPWVYLLILAGLLQPLVGLQVFLVTSMALTIHLALNKKLKQLPWKAMGGFMLAMGPWIYVLSRYNGGHADPDAFMNIMEFRLSHHFFPSSFSEIHLVLFTLMALFAIRFYRQRLKWLMILMVAGCLVYTIGVEKFRLPLVLYTQWWKTTIWLEAFAFIAIAASLERWLPLSRRIARYGALFPLIVLLLVAGYRWSFGTTSTIPYMFPWSDTISDEVDISRQAGQLTTEDAVFILPVDFTAFRWYARRSIYVDYKSMLHQEDFLTEWYSRIQNIYAFSLTEKKAGFELSAFSTTLLSEPSNISVQYWTRHGITHIVSPNKNIPYLKRIAVNDSYAVYALK